jgi:hypothetical protein
MTKLPTWLVLALAALCGAAIALGAWWWRPTVSADLPAPEQTRITALISLPTPAPTGIVLRPLDPARTPVPHTRFGLHDGHAGLSCTACHQADTPPDTVSSACIACHAADEPHNGAFGSRCELCHIPAGWQMVSFSHEVIGEEDCSSCHAPPANHFPGACRACHLDTTSFRNATFNHTFPLNHGDANRNCAACHPGNVTTTYSCFGCHDQAKMVREHAKEDIFDITHCVRCHADGEEPDDD